MIDFKKIKFKNLKKIYLILSLIHKNYSLHEIRHKLNISKQNLNYYIKVLKKYNFIELKLKTNITYYQLTQHGLKFLIYLKQYFSKKAEKYKSKFNYHNLQIKFKILSIENDALQYDKIVKTKKTEQKIKVVNEFPFQFTLKNINNKTILVYLHQKTFSDINEFHEYIFRFSIFLYHYLLKNGIKIDPLSGEVVNQHISILLPKPFKELLENVAKDKQKIEIDLNRDAVAPLKFKSKKKAKVWIDRSLGELELETNDLKYLENFLLMPENIDKLLKITIYNYYDFSKNLKEHTEAIKKLNKLLEKLLEITDKKL